MTGRIRLRRTSRSKSKSRVMMGTVLVGVALPLRKGGMIDESCKRWGREKSGLGRGSHSITGRARLGFRSGKYLVTTDSSTMRDQRRHVERHTMGRIEGWKALGPGSGMARQGEALEEHLSPFRCMYFYTNQSVSHPALPHHRPNLDRRYISPAPRPVPSPGLAAWRRRDSSTRTSPPRRQRRRSPRARARRGRPRKPPPRCPPVPPSW